MADVAADVPGKFDMIIDGKGYIFSNTINADLPFRVQRAAYGLSPTFIPRQNVSGNFGDDQQDFWLTASQNDWSLGEGQRFLRVNDNTSKRRYWVGAAVDVTKEGQLTLAGEIETINFTGTARCGVQNSITFYVANDTNLYSVLNSTVTSLGAHGAGSPVSMASDGDRGIYMAGGTTFRRWDRFTTTFSTFSATNSLYIAYAGNTVYGLDGSTFRYYSTAGVASTAYTFKDGVGNTAATYGLGGHICAFAGGVVILRSSAGAYELYTGNTGGVTQIGVLPPTFFPQQLLVSRGVVFISGYSSLQNLGTRSEVYYYNNGILDLLWHGEAGNTHTHGWLGASEFQDGIIFNDPEGGRLVYYDLTRGAFSTVGSFTSPNVQSQVHWGTQAGDSYYVNTNGTTGARVYGSGQRAASSGSAAGSLIDFESSLDKYVKAVKVDWIPATDGDGGSVDIAYQINSLDGAYTNVQTGATAGTEYTIGQACRSISIKITLNRGTSTRGPILKRVYVRAAPVQQTFRSAEVVIDLTGINGKNPVKLRNGNDHPKDGLTMATELRATAVAAVPVSITDRFGTYTGIIEGGDGFDLVEVRPEEFLARVKIRQV